MVKFILKKIVYGFIVLFGAVTVVFFLFDAVPGDPTRLMSGQHTSEKLINQMKRELGLDLPAGKRYLLYLNDISPVSIHKDQEKDTLSHLYLDTAKYSVGATIPVGGDKVLVIKKPYLRRSYQTRQKVNEIISEAMPGTIVLAVTSIVLATVLGILLGILAAVKRGTFLDSSALVFAVLGMSAPSFYSATLVSWLFGYLWHETVFLPGIPILFLAGGIVYGIVMNRSRMKQKVQLLDVPRKFSFSRVLEMTVKAFGLGIAVWMLGLIVNGIFDVNIIPVADWQISFPGTGLPNTGSFTDFYFDEEMNPVEYIAWDHLILPALTLGIRPLAIIVQLTRSSLLEVLSQDYIRTATAKGLSFYKVVVKHALKNALNPVVTAISGWFASLLAGAVFIEYVFDWHGLGLQLYNSLITQDLPVAMGGVLVISTTFVVINLLVDILYGLLDPRVRIG